MEGFISFLQTLDRLIWQPLFVILMGTGLFMTYRLRGIQFTKLWYSLKLAFTRRDDNARGDISQFQALMTALAGTIGIGNIAGIATAIAFGGLGAIFWLWVTALIGMATKYSEAILAVQYRIVDDRGEMAGGPMYFIERGLGWKWLAILFALFGAIAAVCTGNIVQSQSIASALGSSLDINPWISGAVVAACTGLVLLGGIKSIGKIAAFLVPFMAVVYIAACLFLLAVRVESIPEAIGLIISTAFTGQAAIGGFVGSTIMMAIQIGVARGVFSNESGLGSAPIAAAAAKTDLPGRQALISMTGAFLSTIVCTFTGLAIAVTNVLGQSGLDGKTLTGAPMTIVAFDTVIPFGGLLVVLCSILFGYTTIIGWAYYGEKCCEYLFGTRAIVTYRILFTLFAFVAVGLPLEVVWATADIANALMALPNLIGLLGLSGIVAYQTRIFLHKVQEEAT